MLPQRLLPLVAAGEHFRQLLR